MESTAKEANDSENEPKVSSSNNEASNCSASYIAEGQVQINDAKPGYHKDEDESTSGVNKSENANVSDDENI